MKGRGIGKFKKGARITSFDQIKVGMLLVDCSMPFGATNLIKVVSLDDSGLNRRIFYWRYANGDDGGRLYGSVPADDKAARMAMWDWEFEKGAAQSSDLWEAKLPASSLRAVTDYQSLLDWFDAGSYDELNQAATKKLGRAATVVLYAGLDWLERDPEPGFELTRFEIEAFDGKDTVSNTFQVPADEEMMAIGLVELEDPDKARAEGEEFLFMLGQVQAEMEVR